MPVSDAKFSTFAFGGDLVPGDVVVGLRNGVNTRFNNTGGVGTFLPLTGGTMAGVINMGGFKITDLATPTDPADAVTKAYADLFLPLAGGTMSGAIAMGSHKITDLLDPTDPQDAATKAYVDSTGSGTVSPGLINQLTWYAASGDTVSGLATAANGVLVTDGSSVPSISSTLPSAVQANITTVGTIGTGIWHGTAIGAQYGGTGLSSITAHNLLVGNGTSPTTLLAPSATVGIPLVSQGASADPAYSTAVVAGGGTGITSATAYAVLCGGTTSTGAFQTVSGLGSANQVLVSQGAGALPQWASVPGLVPAALTEVNDTNVTLTLGGSPSTALLQATSITAGWTGQLSLTRGGTNASLTASTGGIVYSGASALAILGGTATANLPLLSGSSAAPTWAPFALSLGGALTTAGALTTSGAFGATFTFTNTTSVTFPTSGTLATTSQIPTGAALTKTDDTNVTLTLGGSPSTALVNAASLTLGWTGQLGLSRGGTNASLTASNGAIPYSTASALALLAPGTSGQLLQSGGAGAPSWTTATFPAAAGSAGTILRSNGTNWLASTATFADTYTASNLLYSNGANTVTGLATANSSVLVTSSGGVPSLSTTLPSGISATNMALTTPTIKGSNGFNVATFSDVASAVDYLTFQAGVANGVFIQGVSSNANMSFSIQGKGGGGVVIGSSGATTSPMAWGKNGTTFFNIQIPTWTANRNLNLPDADVTLVAGTMAPTVSPSFTTPTLGVATATSITWSDTTKGIVGTTTNDNAAAGYVGEFISSEVAPNTVTLSNSVIANVTSISLTAGDWDLFGCVSFTATGAVVETTIIGGISNVSANVDGNFCGGALYQLVTSFTTGGNQLLGGLNRRISINTTTTIYLIADAAFSGGTSLKAGGFIGARRVR